MDWTRRELLGSCLGVGGAGAAGCLSRESNIRYPEAESDGAADRPLVDEDSAIAGSGADAQMRTGADSRPNPELARQTDRIYGELRWFAAAYDATMEAYRTAVNEAIRKLRAVQSADGFDDVALKQVRSILEGVRERTRELLGAHFAVDRLIGDTVTYHERVVEKFAERGDVDRVEEELGRLVRFLDGVSGEAFVEAQMPKHPIQNRLFSWLRRTAERPVLFELYHSWTKFRAYAYAGDRQNVLEAPFEGEPKSEYDAAFEPLSAKDEREDLAYVVPRPLSADESLPPLPPRRPSSLASMPVYLQRFEDVPTATRTRESLLAGPLTTDGYREFGHDEWRQVYYDRDGDVTYAFLIQAGKYLLATAPSETAWEERVDWDEPLRRTWLWRTGGSVSAQIEALGAARSP